MSISAPASNEKAESTRHADAPPAESRRSLVDLDDMQDYQQKTAGKSTPRADAESRDVVLDFNAYDLSTAGGMQQLVTDGYTQFFAKLKKSAQGVTAQGGESAGEVAGDVALGVAVEGARAARGSDAAAGENKVTGSRHSVDDSKPRGDGQYANPEQTLDADTGNKTIKWNDGVSLTQLPNGRGTLTLPDGRVQRLSATETRSLHRDAEGRITVKDTHSSHSWKYDGEKLREETIASNEGAGLTRTFAADDSVKEKHFGPKPADNYEVDRNAKDQVEKIVYPDGKSVEFSYNERGTVETYKDRDGVTWKRMGESNSFMSDKKNLFGMPGLRTGDITVDAGGLVKIHNDGDGTTTTIKPDGGTKVDLPNLDHEQFSRLLEQNWSRIDTNHDSRLSKKEIDQAVTSNNFTGEDAQMIVALKKQYDKIVGLDHNNLDRWLNGVSHEDIKKFDQVIKDLDAQKEYAEKVGQFIGANFDQIDANRDGQIQKNEIDKFKKNICLTEEGEQMLKNFKDNYDRLRGDKKTVDKDMVNNYASVVANSDNGKMVSGIDNAMNGVESSVEDQNRSLYGSSDPMDSIKPDAIHQGGIGDCYFLAAMGSLAATNPQAIKDMIKDNGNGTYTVTFPGDKKHPVTVKAPTDAELALYVKSGNYGVWPAVLEKAYGDWKRDTTIPQEGAGGGDQIDVGIDILTGKKTDKHKIKDYSEDELGKMLTDAFRNGESITTDCWNNPKNARGGDLPTGHAYSVIGYDASTGMVTIRNPWGSGELKDENGRPLDGKNDGVFTMSLKEYRERFKNIAIEGH